MARRATFGRRSPRIRLLLSGLTNGPLNPPGDRGAATRREARGRQNHGSSSWLIIMAGFDGAPKPMEESIRLKQMQDEMPKVTSKPGV